MTDEMRNLVGFKDIKDGTAELGDYDTTNDLAAQLATMTTARDEAVAVIASRDIALSDLQTEYDAYKAAHPEE